MSGTDGFARYLGLGKRGPSFDFDAPLFPESAPCPLLVDAPARYPGARGGEALGFAPDASVLVVSGGEGDTEVAAGALVVDVATARVSALSAEDGPPTRRAGATSTAFGSGLLVAGGRDPVEGGLALASADVFDANERRFEPSRIELERARAHHGATTLSSGEVLLVGGVDDAGHALRTLEAVSPESRRYRVSGLADLSGPRVDPVVLRLSDDRILVAGGTDSLGEGAPVSSLEWLTSDAAAIDHALEALGDATLGRAFVPMPGGGVLAAGGCRLTPPGAPPPCTAPCGLGTGCPSSDVFWISPEGDAAALPAALPTAVAEPQLFAGTDGRPWLAAAAAGELFRFDPWLRRFEPVPSPFSAPPLEARFLTLEPGLFAWTSAVGSERASVWVLRHGTESIYSAFVAPLLLRDTSSLSLDRADADAFVPGTGEVVLGGATLHVADTTYADLYLAADVRAGPPPVVRLGTRWYGDAACAWPSTPAAPYVAELAREGDRVRLAVGGREKDCRGPDGRVPVAVGGSPTDPTRLRSLTVRRTSPP